MVRRMSGTTVRRTTSGSLDAAAAAGRSALVGYLPVGYPDLAGSVEAAKVLVDSGADVIELGLPYSDPSMDGSVIQEAADGALRAGTRTRHVLQAVEQVAEAGAQAGVAVVVMTYWNPVLRYGVDAFARDLASAGGAGLITPDLTPDAGPEWLEASAAHDLDRIFLVAPSSTPQRLSDTVAACRGFVYAASLMGVTGNARPWVSTRGPWCSGRGQPVRRGCASASGSRHPTRPPRSPGTPTASSWGPRSCAASPRRATTTRPVGAGASPR